MVTIKIVIEGGVLPNPNIASQTINNSQVLRQSFHKLLIQIFKRKDFDLSIKVGGGVKSARNIFKKEVQNNHCSLLIDLDGKKETRTNRLTDLGIEEYSDFVFFMIQKMEAWILSQPNAIEKGMLSFNREKQNIKLSQDPIFKQPADEMVHPDRKLNTVLSKYYSYQKRGEKKKKKYGKLKDAPLFIEHLNATELKKTFEDVNNLFDFINKNIPNTR